MVKTCKINARSAVTDQPIAGVSYLALPKLGDDMKQRAIAPSAALSASKPPRPNWDPNRRVTTAGAKS